LLFLSQWDLPIPEVKFADQIPGVKITISPDKKSIKVWFQSSGVIRTHWRNSKKTSAVTALYGISASDIIFTYEFEFQELTSRLINYTDNYA